MYIIYSSSNVCILPRTPLVVPWNHSSRKLLSETDRRRDKTIHELFIFVHAPMRTYTLGASIRRHLPHKGQCGLRASAIRSRGEASWGLRPPGLGVQRAHKNASVCLRVCVCTCASLFKSSDVPQNAAYVTVCAHAASVRRACIAVT